MPRSSYNNLNPGFIFEAWLLNLVRQMRATARLQLTSKQVLHIAETLLPHKTEIALSYIDPQNLDVDLLLDRVFKVDCLMRLEDAELNPYIIGIDATLGTPQTAKHKLREIQQPSFVKARKALGIDRHYVICVSGDANNPDGIVLPAFGDVIDALLNQVDKSPQCAVLCF
jgi:hypothetical protein